MCVDSVRLIIHRSSLACSTFREMYVWKKTTFSFRQAQLWARRKTLLLPVLFSKGKRILLAKKTEWIFNEAFRSRSYKERKNKNLLKISRWLSCMDSLTAFSDFIFRSFFYAFQRFNRAFRRSQSEMIFSENLESYSFRRTIFHVPRYCICIPHRISQKISK